MDSKKRLLVETIQRILREEDSPIPKGETFLIKKGDPKRGEIVKYMYDLVVKAYEDIGGHFKINKPSDLEQYSIWVFEDIDADDNIDLAFFGKPGNAGHKMSAVGHDGSPAARTRYKDLSAELRKGRSIDGVGNWWGEVSGKIAYALLKRGAPALTNESAVKFLMGDKIEWLGEHPDPNAPPLFKQNPGWYVHKIGGRTVVKIIVGSPE